MFLGEADAVRAHAGDATEAEARLLAGLRERRPEACAELYERASPGILRFAISRLGDVGTAEDVVVETMADAVRDLQRFNPRRSSLATWVLGIARRRVNLEIRRLKRRKSVPESAQVPPESVLEVSDGSDLAASAADRLDARRKVAALRSLLSDAEMEVLVLSCVEELSAREIGQVIGRSERAVHSILHRAKAKARERLVGDE
jgi:RNA polymerase sigma-70 factor (ECF subfamily)